MEFVEGKTVKDILLLLDPTNNNNQRKGTEENEIRWIYSNKVQLKSLN